MNGPGPAGFIFGGDEEKLLNNNRVPDTQDELYIYSRSSFGALMTLAVNYQASARFKCGLEGQLTGTLVESGYHRWGSYDERSKDWEIFPSIGPKVGYEFVENFTIETAYHFGDHSDAALTLSYTF